MQTVQINAYLQVVHLAGSLIGSCSRSQWVLQVVMGSTCSNG